jgi:UDP-N-acetylglucosamine 2-epimerase (non-hydrolysing)
MLKVLIVFGTRPEAIKMAPLVLEMKKFHDVFDVTICVTAQHRELLDQVLNIFGIIPDLDLDIMKKSQGLSDLTSNILTEIAKVLEDLKPDLVLVHGDTTTTLATSLACFYAGIKVGHVEAGLRTHNLKSPFPEEFNRQVVTKITDIHFAPTDHCRNNLIEEGTQTQNIFVTGNTVIDALTMTLRLLDSNESIKAPVIESIDTKLDFDWKSLKFVLITGHRRENFGLGFLEICNSLKELSELFPDVHFVYPVHLNPNVQEPVNRILGNIANIHLIAPLDYPSFSMLLKSCYLVLTDSGGLQEEAPSLGIPLILMRETTERPEAVEAGTARLVGTSKERIVSSVTELLLNQSLYEEMATAHNPFGEGDATHRIIEAISAHFNL